jgi:hypothetical protein
MLASIFLLGLLKVAFQLLKITVAELIHFGFKSDG